MRFCQFVVGHVVLDCLMGQRLWPASVLGCWDICREACHLGAHIFWEVVLRPECPVRLPVLSVADMIHNFEICVGRVNTSSTRRGRCRAWCRRIVLFCALCWGRVSCGAYDTCRPHTLRQRGPSEIANRSRMSHTDMPACNMQGGFLMVQKLGKPLSLWCKSKALVCWVKGMSCVSLVLAALFELGLCSLGLS